MALLHRHGELCVCEIQAVLGISQSRASRHLKTLRQAGLVEARRVGTWAHYRIADHPGPSQKSILDILATLVGQDALSAIDQKLEAFRQTQADPCAQVSDLSFSPRKPLGASL